MPSIELILNPSGTTELLREGWSLTRTAAAFRGASWDPELGKYGPGEFAYDLDEGGNQIDSTNLWSEPETGIVTLRPHPLRDDLYTNPDWASYWMGLSAFDHAAEDFKEIADETAGTSQPKWITISRDDATAALTGIDVPDWLDAFQVPTANRLTWALASTDILSANEATSFIIHFPGTPNDRALSPMAICIGGLLVLLLGMNGQAKIYQRVTEGTNEHWLPRKRFTYSQGGPNADDVFQLTVLPLGIDGICFAFSQVTAATATKASTHSSEGAFYFSMKKHGYTPAYDATLKHYVKVPAGKLYIALPTYDFQVGLSVCRVRYGACGLILAPEPIDEPKAGKTPVVDTLGYYPSDSKVQHTKTVATTGPTYTNEKNLAWTAASDVWLVASAWLKPSTDLKYSPEIWAMEYDIPATTHAPETTPWDISDRWQRLCFRISSEPDSSFVSWLYKRDGDWKNLLKLDGGYRLSIDGVEIREGHVLHSRPTILGAFGEIGEDGPRSLPLLQDDAEGSDEWEDLNETSLSHFASVTSKSFGLVIEKAFRRAGVPDELVNIDPELYDLEVDGWDRPNDWKLPQETTTAGDVFRGILDRYGAQGNGGGRDIRIVRVRGEFYAYLRPAYDPEATPPLVFYAHPDCLPVPEATDAERWDAGYLKILSNVELTVRRPRWNSLKAWAAIGDGDGADAIAAFIAPHPAAMTDSSDVDFQGRVRSRTFGPPETSWATTGNELERLARRRFDKDCRVERHASFDAEWHPWAWSDDLAWIVGPAIEDGDDYGKGDIVSYGAWWVVSIDCQVEMDDAVDGEPANAFWGTHARSRKFGRQGRYSLEYAGETAIEGVPMFAPQSKLPYEGRIPVDA